jgi:hypothetical protein
MYNTVVPGKYWIFGHPSSEAVPGLYQYEYYEM